VIIVEISGPTVAAGGGVWAGMSGSPVYIDHGGGPKLAGALAYGFSFGATNIAGLTPAKEMVDGVNGLPLAPKVPARLKLPRSMVRKVANKIGAALPTVGGSLVRLKVPVSVSGVTPERFRQMRKLPFFKKYRTTMKYTVRGGHAVGPASPESSTISSPAGTSPPPSPTETSPQQGSGRRRTSAAGRRSPSGTRCSSPGGRHSAPARRTRFAIVPDALGPYKLANVTSPVGTLDQDRLAGIRAVNGEPPSIPITTAITSLDSDNAHTGTTDVVFTEALSRLRLLPHLLQHRLRVRQDRFGLGVLQLDDRRKA
jgi:hypothetical protein